METTGQPDIFPDLRRYLELLEAHGQKGDAKAAPREKALAYESARQFTTWFQKGWIWLSLTRGELAVQQSRPFRQAPRRATAEQIEQISALFAAELKMRVDMLATKPAAVSAQFFNAETITHFLQDIQRVVIGQLRNQS